MPSLRVRILLIAGLVLPPAAAAHAQLGMADGTMPVNVQADNGIEWQQTQQLYIARGNAVATRGPAAIKADTLIAHYRQGKSAQATGAQAKDAGGGQGNTEIYRVEAARKVVINRD